MGSRIVIATWGSRGDLHPYLAIAARLREHGHCPVIATLDAYKPSVEEAGFGFAPLGPHLVPDEDFMSRAMHQRRGPEYLIRDVLYGNLRKSYEESLAAIEGADLLVTHGVTFGAQLAAEKTGIRWVSTVLCPMQFFSAHDPSVPGPSPWLGRLRTLGLRVNRGVVGLGRLATRRWLEPVRSLRADLGLPPGRDPLFEGQHSPHCVLALFSSVLAAPQPDWPPQTHQTGFCFYDQPAPLDPALARFLDDGPPPVVFTLGSSAAGVAGDFYEESAEAARRLGCRALLLVGIYQHSRAPESLPPGIAAFPYAPYSEVFSRAAAIVHQGGVGTTAEALRAGRPMLVVPYGFDQPDNGARVARLGAGRIIPRGRYTAARAAAALDPLLRDPAYTVAAKQAACRIQSEDGAGAAAAAIEQMLT